MKLIDVKRNETKQNKMERNRTEWNETKRNKKCLFAGIWKSIK